LELDFLERFEGEFLTQAPSENRSIEESLDLAWKILSIFDLNKLKKINTPEAKAFYSRENQIENAKRQQENLRDRVKGK
jgi:vacuolar-type H+-ATPase subunit B/Vma2